MDCRSANHRDLCAALYAFLWVSSSRTKRGFLTALRLKRAEMSTCQSDSQYFARQGTDDLCFSRRNSDDLQGLMTSCSIRSFLTYLPIQRHLCLYISFYRSSCPADPLFVLLMYTCNSFHTLSPSFWPSVLVKFVHSGEIWSLAHI